MKITDNGISLSPSDLSNHLGCMHLTQLDLLVQEGLMDPPNWLDPSLAVLQQRGLAFEQSYLKSLEDKGFRINMPDDDSEASGIERTVSAMREGYDYIYQARIIIDNWGGTADFLKRIPKSSSLGEWSYEVVDTKLAKETRAGAVLQLCIYTQAVEIIQNTLPEHLWIVSPDGELFKETSFRTPDYLAYHRLMQMRIVQQIDQRPESYPEPMAQCDICKWWPTCDKKRRVDDHLCLVAGISRSQRAELKTWGINRVESLATLPLPLDRKPTRGIAESFVKIREQARLQVESKLKGELVYEVLEQKAPHFDEAKKDVVLTGLYRLPEPNPGDIFLDFEGDPFVGTSGLDYLFGWIEETPDGPEFKHLWAFDMEDEKMAFESFIDRVFEQKEKYPDLHIYHFAHYETSTLKRLMGRYATRATELDWLLRGKRFVDLHAIVKQTIRAGVEAYSLKNLEPLFGFSRKTDLRSAALAKRNLEFGLELNLLDTVPEVDRLTTLHYNREDCEAAFALRKWLIGIRDHLNQDGANIFPPAVVDGSPKDEKQGRDEELQKLYEKLVSGVPADVHERSDEQQAKWLLANLLEYHSREEKSGWWEYFDLLNKPVEELVDAKIALGLLAFNSRYESQENYVVNEYTFPPQDSEVKVGNQLYGQAGIVIGSVTNIDTTAGILLLKQSLELKDEFPDGLVRMPIRYDTTFAKPGAVRRIAEWALENGTDAAGPFRAVRDLLLQKEPNPSHDQLSHTDKLVDKAVLWSKLLQHSVLSIQGPPGAGKTFTGANIIIALIKAGKKVGVTANSHKVIDTLLEEVIKQAGSDMELICGHKVSTREDITHPGIKPYTSIDTVLSHLQKGKVHVIGGTPIMWANQKFYESVDVLIIDEAGQLSLADTIAAGQAAHNLVLLGDPQQLKQPQQGTHPDGTEVSALEHILGEHQTIPQEKGLFLDTTHRMHPSICAYISELFYESKLHSYKGLELQVLSGATKYLGAGLWLEQVEHEGQSNNSPEEVVCVKRIIEELTSGHVIWTNQDGEKKIIDHADILVIAPYNAHVGKLREELPVAVQVGTVDKFQGRQAPIVIYSMASSSPEDAPRGMEFLYNLNRLNVAVSRARTAAILVANPKLFSPECRIPEQMRMANGVCRYAELSITNVSG